MYGGGVSFDWSDMFIVLRTMTLDLSGTVVPAACRYSKPQSSGDRCCVAVPNSTVAAGVSDSVFSWAAGSTGNDRAVQAAKAISKRANRNASIGFRACRCIKFHFRYNSDSSPVVKTANRQKGVLSCTVKVSTLP